MGELALLLRVLAVHTEVEELAGELLVEVQALVLLHTAVVDVELTQLEHLRHVEVVGEHAHVRVLIKIICKNVF